MRLAAAGERRVLFALDVEPAAAGAYSRAAFDDQCAELARFSAKVCFMLDRHPKNDDTVRIQMLMRLVLVFVCG